MASAPDELVAALNDLVELNKDSAKGFIRAKNDVTDEELTHLFDTLSRERTGMADDLQQAVQQLGSKPEEEGSAAGALERGWLNIKAAMTIEHDKTDAIVVTDRAEHEAEVRASYMQLLDRSLPPPVARLLRRQAEQVKQAHQNLERLQAKISESNAARSKR